ncbi:MAG: GNAT family N-acetyltransferase [Pseudomonadota bacterium]
MNERPLIAKLAIEHDAANFDCGQEDLNDFINRYALAGQWANISRTYAAVQGAEIAGYHTLVVGSVVYEGAPERLGKGIPRHPIPALLLARLAVDKRRQGKGLGAALVVDAMRRTLQVADIAGVRAMLIHAKDATARDFYMHLGFEPFPGEPFVLHRLLKDIRAMLK